MKDFKRLVLCNYHDSQVEVHVRADLTDGKLTLTCQDFGPVVEEIWGDDDYEYWYLFDRKETAKLIKALHGESDPEGALLKHFSGEGGCGKLTDFCDKRGITYKFTSYV